MTTWIIGGGAIAAATARLAAQTGPVHLLSHRHLDIEHEQIIVHPVASWAWENVQEALTDWPKLTRLVVATGMLWNDKQKPEKRLEDLSAEALQNAFMANTLLPMSVLQAVSARLTRQDPMQALVVTAKVGSIADNHLGGWYAYRASKAAANMLIKNTAIEWQRRFPKAALGAYHPGTTDSTLSQPFQATLPAGQLKTPEEAAECLWSVLSERLTPETTGRFWHWDGSELPW